METESYLLEMLMNCFQESSNTAFLGDLESENGLMEITMRANTLKGISKDQDFLSVKFKVGNMMASGKEEKWMELQFVNGQMELLTQGNGRIAGKKVKELYNFLMELFIKASFKMINLMELEKKYFPMAAIMKVTF